VSRDKKIAPWVIGGLGVLFIFLVGLIALLPTLINLGPIREKILADISQTVGGQVACERFELSFLPRPHVTIYQARLSIPGKVSGNLASVTMHPRIPSILMGKVCLASVKVAAPDLTVAVQGKGPDKIKEKSKPFSVVAIQERVAPLFAVLASQAPSLRVQVENAKLRVSEDKQPVFECQDIRAFMELPANQVKVDVTGFAFRTDGLRDLRASLASSPPSVTGGRLEEPRVIKGKDLRVTSHINRDKTVMSLVDLNLNEPQVNITGELLLKQTSPQVSLELEGREIGVDSTRDAALALAGDIAATRRIFEIVKGGKAPLIHLRTHGNSWHDLGKGENILIKGSMLDGKIFVPGVHLDLEDVKGDVIISKGILEGNNLEARMGSIGGREGTLKLGLRGKNAPFHLDMLIQADLAQLHPVLKRLAANQSFGHEMDLIDNLQGYGTGRLVLGESTTSIKTRLDLSEFNLSGYYKRIPYPLEISGQDFSYNERTVHARQLSGKLGKSSFAGVSLGLDWEKRPHLELKSPRFEMFLGEVYSWLASLDRSKVYLRDFKRVDGVVSLSELRLEGPLFQPEDWQWETRGEIRYLAADTSLLPGPIKVTGGDFDAIEEATEQRFSFRDAQVTLLDASLSVSGVLGDFLKGLNETDITLQGKMGREATQWVSDAIGLPPQYHIRPRVSISHGHLVWDRDTKTSFVGDLTVQNGPRLSLDILRNPEELMIKKLLVQDGDSHASLKLDLKHKDLSLEFAGPLTKGTMDKLLVKNQFFHGWINGELSAQILLDRPSIPKAQGKLKGEDLILPLNLKVPVTIDSFSLNAIKDHLKVESAILTWGEDRMALGGSVKLLADGVVLDMDLSADNLEWDKVEEIMERVNRKDDLAPEKNQWDLPVGGILRFKTEHFKYDQLTWSPFYADISFADNGVDVAVTEANLCGISTPGILRMSPQGLRLDFKPVSTDQDLAPTLTCLGDKNGLVTGKFDLKGEVMTQGKGEGWLKSLRGDSEFLAHNGRIYRHGMLAKIFAFLNVAGIVSGQFPDITQEGFPYHSIKAKGSLQNGKLVLKEGHISSPSMEIACQGDIDLLDKELDLQYLVAPLKTVDLVVKNIPLVSNVLNGTLVSIPVKVTGPWADPAITALSPSAVGSGLLGIIKRTVQLPLQMIEPRAPEEKPN
jgi:hypothetical protein